MNRASDRAPPANFDRLARIYRALEFVAFGGDLERARFCHLDWLRDRRDILVLGEGDGRCLARLVDVAPAARIHCVDASAAMLEAADLRLSAAHRDRVQFTQANVLTIEFDRARYDAVTTFFFLDCFTSAQVATIAERIGAALRRDALWLFADFVVPPAGWRRVRAQVWLGTLYLFFRWQTGLRTRVLPASERVIEQAGFRVAASESFQHGLLRTTVYRDAR